MLNAALCESLATCSIAELCPPPTLPALSFKRHCYWCVYLCVRNVSGCTIRGTHAKVRPQLYEVISLLPPLHRFRDLSQFARFPGSHWHTFLNFEIESQWPRRPWTCCFPDSTSQKGNKLHHQTQRKIRWSKCARAVSPKFKRLQSKQRKPENFSLKNIPHPLSCPCWPQGTESAICVTPASKCASQEAETGGSQVQGC